MARKNKKNKAKWHEGLKPETKQSVFAIASFALAVIFTLAAFGKAGFVGNSLQRVFELLFGNAFFLIPLVFFIAGISLFRRTADSLRERFVMTTLVGGILFLLAALGIVDLISDDMAGGYLGRAASYPFFKLFDFWAAIILLSALLVVGFLVMMNIALHWPKKEKKEEEEKSFKIPQLKLSLEQKPLQIEKPEEKPALPKEELKPALDAQPKTSEEFIASPIKKIRRAGAAVLLPPLDLLEDDRGTPSSGDIKANANIIKRTLQNFGIEVEMAEVNIGPSVTQYTLKPAEGVKLSRITGLQNDLALALAAHPLRIEAPIPGRSLVGVEIPNRSIALVGLRSLFSADDFQKSQSALPFALGRDVSGRGVYADFARLPHMLIAGATGTGKSVSIHSILMSMLYKNSPETLRFIIIDPKRVELAAYSKIPHLLTPVITDAKKAILSLKWAAKEMERRYEVLSGSGARDIRSYHTNVLSKEEDAESMPYIMIVIDELADIMATYPRELEASIVRLAQMSRAVGIHLMLSTQRPSVEVITGLIKANITSRIAFQVASQVDSRTILDTSGAEKLLGNGDMLFLAGDIAKPRRIQGAFVSENEVKKVTKWLSENVEPEPVSGKDDVFAAKNGDQTSAGIFGVDDGDEVDDDLYEEAKRLAIEAGKISASYLQRRLRVGYARAARLLDLMEDHGVIGPADGAKPREVLVKNDAHSAREKFDNFEPEPERETEKMEESLESEADEAGEGENAETENKSKMTKNERNSSGGDFFKSF